MPSQKIKCPPHLPRRIGLPGQATAGQLPPVVREASFVSRCRLGCRILARYASQLTLHGCRERRMGNGASRRAGVGRVRSATLSTACQQSARLMPLQRRVTRTGSCRVRI